jgi:hypothetical protein
MKRRGEQGSSYAGIVHQVTLQAVLRAMAGPVAVLDDFSMTFFDAGLRRGDRVFYDNFFDLTVPGTGWVLANHAHLIYLTGFRLLLGVRHSVVHALYPGSWLAASGGESPGSPHHRVGPLAAYVFRSPWRAFQQPTVILLLSWWIGNRYRSGGTVHQAVPYGAVAFQVGGDLWWKE